MTFDPGLTPNELQTRPMSSTPDRGNQKVSGEKPAQPRVDRNRSPVLIGFSVILVAIIIAAGMSGFIRDGVRRALIPTTADPDVLGLVSFTSNEIVKVQLRKRRAAGLDGPRPHTGASVEDAVLGFRVPAAFLSVMDLREGSTGSQRLGFSTWSDNLLPFQPDFVRRKERTRDNANSRIGTTAVDGDDPFLDRRRGAYELRFEVTNQLRDTPSDRERSLLVNAGARSVNSGETECGIRLEQAGSLLRVVRDEPTSPGPGCRFLADAPNYTSFIGNDEIGRPRFSVRCARGAPICQMQTFFGSWPLFVWVRQEHSNRWEAELNKIEAFLVRYSQPI